MAPKKPKTEEPEIELLEEGEDLDRLYKTFDIDDQEETDSIVNGSVGEDFE